MFNKYTLHNLKKELIEILNDERAEILADPYAEDRLSEIVDGVLPLYHSHLAEILADEPRLGNGPDDAGLIGEQPTVWQIITAALYEELSAEAWEWLETARQEAAEAEETAAENEAAAEA